MTAIFASALVYIGLLCATGGDLGSEPGTPLIRNYTILDYGADPQNWAIVQDHSGVMYFGNNDGVLMYDGTHWDLVPTCNRSMVNALAVDDAGRIYVGGSAEFGYLQANDIGLPTYVSLSKDLEGEDAVFGKVWNVHCTSRGVYYRARERMFLYDGQTIEVLPLKNHKRSTVFADAVLYNGRDYGLWVLDEKGSRMLPHTREILGGGVGTIMMPLSDTVLLLAVRGLGLFEYDLAPFLDGQVFRETFDPDAPVPKRWENDVEDYLLENQFYTGWALENGFAFGTKLGGVVVTNREGRLSRFITRDRGLFRNRVNAVYQDRHKNLWIALNNGLAHAEINTPFSMFAGGKSSHEGVLSLADSGGRLYVGAFNGLFCLDENDRFQLLDKGQSGFWAFFTYKGRLLAASTEIYEIDQLRVQKLETIQPYKQTTYCMNSSPRFPDHLFTGNRDGVRVLKTESGNSLRITEDFYVKGIHEEIRRIEADPAGNLWLSTRFSGLIYLQLDEHNLSAGRVYRFGKQHGLPRLDKCLTGPVKGRWRVATQEGVYRLQPADDPASFRFVPDPDFSSFSGKSVQQIFEDGGGRTWVTSTNEMGFFLREGENAPTWYQQPFKRIGEGLLHIADDGVVWVDAELGLYRYTGGTGPVKRRPFQTLVHRVSVNDKMVYGGFVAGQPKTTEWPVLTMPRDIIGGAVSFAYSATFYEDSEANRFRFFLEGYDKHWSDWSKDTRTNYTNLAGGTYRFRVESMNLYDQHGSMATVELVVPEPWYHTGTAYTLFAFAVLLLLAAVISATAIIQKRRHEQRRQYERKQQELQKFETLGRLAGGIAHDFNGILATIYGFTHHIEKATRDLPGLALPFDEIEKAGQRGEDLVRQILAFSRGEKPRNKLLDASLELHRALDLAQITLPPKVTLVRRIDGDAGWLKGDPTRCHQVILNLFRNAVQALGDQGGTIEVGLDRNVGPKGEERLRTWVRDTGEGMDSEMQAHLFEPFYSSRSQGEGTGLGLWVVHGIITSMGGSISVSSSPGKGSLFEMFFARQEAPVPALAEVTADNLPKGQGQRVLWVDNSKQRLREGTLLLRDLRYKARGALIDEFPLADLERDPEALDLIVLGCNEAPCQGQEILKQIRVLRADIPVICCAASDHQELAGFQGRFDWPLVPKRLAQLVFDAFGLRTEGGIT